MTAVMVAVTPLKEKQEIYQDDKKIHLEGKE